MIQFEDFAKVELRTATIEEVNEHPNADKLYVIKAVINDKTIQLVAGIKKAYKPDTLVGKTIIVVANLAPRVVRGIESQGMLLAAQGENDISILTVDKPVASGSSIR